MCLSKLCLGAWVGEPLAAEENETMNAEELFKTHIKETAKNLIEHTTRVVNLCQVFSEQLENLGIGVDKTLLLDGAWLHDIAKFDHGNDHHKQENVNHILTLCGVEDVEPYGDITYVISMHKDGFQPQKFPIESAILRTCDKLDGFNKESIRAKKSCKISLEKIEKVLDAETFELFKKVYYECYASVQHKKKK